MKFSDSLLNAVKGILEAKPRVSFDGDKATVHDKTGKEIKTFNRKDLGGNFRREADSYMAKNYRSLNQAYEPKGESIEEAKQLELPGMGGDKQPELNLKKKDESPIKKVKEAVDPDDEGDVEIIDEKKKHKKLDPVGKEDGDIDNDGDMDKSDEYLHNRRKAIKHAMKKEEVEVDEAYRGKGGGYHYPDAVKKHEKMKLKPKYTPAEIEKMDKQKLKDAQNEEVEVDEAKMVPGFIGADGKATSKPTEKDYAANKEYQAMKKKLGDKIPGPKPTKEENEPSKANGGIAHNCATHVSHEEFGLGQCISGMHTIEENEDGTGYVTHYDVMFKSEEGPFIKESVPVEELEILISEKHMHGKKKTVESNEYTDQLADKIRDVEDKKKRKKAEKAYDSGDYEKASKHAGVTYWEK